MSNPLKSVYKFLSPKYQKVFLEYKVKTEPRYGHGKPPHKLLNDIIDKNRNAYKELMKQFLPYSSVFQSIKTRDKGNRRKSACV